MKIVPWRLVVGTTGTLEFACIIYLQGFRVQVHNYKTSSVAVPLNAHVSIVQVYLYKYGFYSVWDMYRVRAVCTSEGRARGSTYSTRAVLSHALY